MKGKILLAFSVFLSAMVFAQNKLNDEAIVSQHKRMVYESWGDFRPYGKWNFLGIQTNFAYATVWGNWAPKRNREYKNGNDIRPLKPTGEEVQRLTALTTVQEKEAEQIKKSVDSAYSRSMADFAHWTNLTVDADPLWVLYYKRMLRPLKEFPEKPSNYQQWQLPSKEVYDFIKSTGELDGMQERLDLLKDKLKVARTAPMPRGKRFIMYHEALIGWRKLLTLINSKNTKTTLILDFKNKLQQYKKELNFNQKTDVEIVREVINQHRKVFEQ